MKKLFLLWSLFTTFTAVAQVSFDFENGLPEQMILNPPGRWCTDPVSPLKGSYSLRHSFDNTDASCDMVFFGIRGLCPGCSTVRWHFLLRYGADPSASNKWSFILSADRSPETISSLTGFNGFAIGVNHTGYDDTLRLWHVSAATVTTVITTGINWQNDVGTNKVTGISVTRESSGRWSVDVTDEEGTISHWEGLCPEVHVPAFSGLMYTYTATRDRLLWIDEIRVEGTFITDTIPPSVISVVALTPRKIEVTFDEETDGSVMTVDNFSLRSGTEVTGVTPVSPSVCVISLEESIENKTEEALMAVRLCDALGNCSLPEPFVFTPVYAGTGDIVISEIMADPSPPLGLPDEEYLEISNISEHFLAVDEFILTAGDDTVFLPSFRLAPGEERILCSTSDTVVLSVYGECSGVRSFPSLNDAGETLSLTDGCHNLIHAVSFTGEFYHDDLRSGGGWSLEMTDTDNPFNEPDTWRASYDPSGGTPGRDNSLTLKATDIKCPEVLAVWPLSNDKARILFDESITGIFTAGEWTINGRGAVTAVPDDNARRAFIIGFNDELVPREVYSLAIPGSATDFAGNRTCLSVVCFGLPEVPVSGEVMFNEILFDPVPPCNDFIELYNNSDKVIDVSRLRISSTGRDGSVSSAVALTSLPRQLLPESFMAFTTAKKSITSFYKCSDAWGITEVGALPTMPDDGAMLTLYDMSLKIIDRMEFSPSMHLIFLSGVEGVALEKVRPDLPSGLATNWHSASETCNWGSPGAPNSVIVPDPATEKGMSLSSARISPDSDGFEDVLAIRVFTGSIDNIISVTIFNDRGYIVRKLAERYVAGERTEFIWDGTSDNGSRLAPGLYMVLTETYGANGIVNRWKKVCALLYR